VTDFMKAVPDQTIASAVRSRHSGTDAYDTPGKALRRI
jgi:hypothetical protein